MANVDTRGGIPPFNIDYTGVHPASFREIDLLVLPTHEWRKLVRNNYGTLEKIDAATDETLLGMRNFGEVGLGVVRQRLNQLKEDLQVAYLNGARQVTFKAASYMGLQAPEQGIRSPKTRSIEEVIKILNPVGSGLARIEALEDLVTTRGYCRHDRLSAWYEAMDRLNGAERSQWTRSIHVLNGVAYPGKGIAFYVGDVRQRGIEGLIDPNLAAGNYTARLVYGALTQNIPSQS